jgi:PBP1b-binding outer membrane lipoprotein LpoB
VAPSVFRLRAAPAALALVALLAAGCGRDVAPTEDVRPVRAITLAPTPVSV